MAKVSAKREALVKKVVKKSWGFVLGGYKNAQADNGTPIPSRTRLVLETYEEVMDTDKIASGFGYEPVAKDIRFLGKERILELIEELADNDGL